MRTDPYLLTVAALLATAGACKSDTKSLCTGSGGAGVIAFASSRSLGQYDIYTMNADGSGATRITTDLGSDLWPAWSHDGTKLAYESDFKGPLDSVANLNVFVSNADGSGAVELTTDTLGEGQPTWSPDGTRIAFVSDSSGFLNIYVMNANGTGLRRLTNDSYNDAMPAWSPDGAQRAVAPSPLPTPRPTASGCQKVMDTLGFGFICLTSDSLTNLCPAWSPDGVKIAYYTDRSGQFEIWIMHADGTSPTQFSFTAAPSELPSWSPDGTRIAFDANGEIVVQYLDGRPGAQLTCSNDLNIQARWHP
jgi:Tol biopolymer transport system component